jgi:DNA polymerase-3 subunit epsilon
MRIIALDFETANQSPNSACQLALVQLDDFVVTRSQAWYLRPPCDHFMFTYLHGISWDQVRHEPSLGELWPELGPWFKDADFLAAHNASFDRNVMNATCAHHAVDAPGHKYLDTVQIARKVWSIFPTKLNLVCEHLCIDLNHHEALSDAQACAQILVQAHEKGWRP